MPPARLDQESSTSRLPRLLLRFALAIGSGSLYLVGVCPETLTAAAREQRG